MVLSAVINHPEERCRPLDEVSDTTMRMLGCVFVFTAVAYSAVRNGSDAEGWRVGATGGGNTGLPVPATAVGEDGEKEKGLIDDEAEGVKYNYSIFHVSRAVPFCGQSELFNFRFGNRLPDDRWVTVDDEPGGDVYRDDADGVAHDGGDG